MANFRTIIEGVEDNNNINDAQWSDWGDAYDVIEAYGPYKDEDISESRAVEIIERAIKSNGETLAQDLAAMQLEVQGQNFAGSWWYRV